MKISNTRRGTIEVALKPTERAILGTNRAIIKFNLNSNDRWIHIQGSSEGAIVGKRHDQAYPFRIYSTHDRIKSFGVEEVETFSPAKGELFGHRPKMNRPIQIRRAKTVVTKLPQAAVNGAAKEAVVVPAQFDPFGLPGGSIEHIRQAVTIINNFKKQHPKDVEVVVGEDGILKLRFLLEF